jgi:hypothetical protein
MLVEIRATTGIHTESASKLCWFESDTSLLVSLALNLRKARADGRDSTRGEKRVKLEGPEEAGAEEFARGVDRSDSKA